jgi:hypothetical protein
MDDVTMHLARAYGAERSELDAADLWRRGRRRLATRWAIVGTACVVILAGTGALAATLVDDPGRTTMDVGPEPTVSTPPPPPTTAETVEPAAAPVPFCAAPTDDSSPWGVALSLDGAEPREQIEAEAGERVQFHLISQPDSVFSAPPAVAVAAGDETWVERWDGTTWVTDHQALGIFTGTPSWTADAEQRWTDALHDASSGTIAIPDDGRRGVFRVILPVFDPANVPDRQGLAYGYYRLGCPPSPPVVGDLVAMPSASDGAGLADEDAAGLRALGFTVTTTPADVPAEEAAVVGQTPAPGTLVELGTNVRLTVRSFHDIVAEQLAPGSPVVLGDDGNFVPPPGLPDDAELISDHNGDVPGWMHSIDPSTIATNGDLDQPVFGWDGEIVGYAVLDLGYVPREIVEDPEQLAALRSCVDTRLTASSRGFRGAALAARVPVTCDPLLERYGADIDRTEDD